MVPQFFSWRFLYKLSVTSLFAVTLNAQSIDSKPAYKTYIVIGAFTVEHNADRLVTLVKKYDMKATVRNNEHRGLYYVYIDESMDRDKMKARVNTLRTQYTQFYDAWAYTGDFTDRPVVKGSPEVKKRNTIQSKVEKTETGVAGAPLQENSELINELETPKKVNPVFEKKENHYYFYFNAINSKNYKEVKGKVNIIDPERAKQLKVAKSHELVELKDPDNGTRRVKVSTDMFGFREVQYVLDLDNPESLKENPSVQLIGDSIIVNFDLKRFEKGDVLVMYNVYFFKDAAIMRPESIYELNSLLDMLKENEDLVVEIHGHTNGNSHGKILHLNLEDKNFFGINGDHKETIGSAKKLSLYRAYTIQNWLIEQGINEERMDIKGWGGKKMIYNKHDTQAEKNVRVEIEILEE